MSKIGNQRRKTQSVSFFLKRYRAYLYFLIVFALFSFLFGGDMLYAIAEPVEAPMRVEVTPREVSMQHWKLARWQDGGQVCDIYLQHPHSPETGEVLETCGYEVFYSWVTTPACGQAVSGGDVTQCSGLFMKYTGTERMTIEQEIVLPDISMDVDALNCAPGDWCDDRLVLRFKAEEPLPDHEISKIHVQINDRERTCKSENCEFKMPTTNEEGIWVEYWADSTYGDTSQHYWIRLRNVKNRETDFYRVDILGDDWTDLAASGAVLWNLFPALDHPMRDFLEQPFSSGFISTTNRYAYLSGNIIRWGYADASSCPDGGVLMNGNASECGEKASAVEVLAWQNQFDETIYAASEKYNVPARAIKGIIAQESQFWPYSQSPYELGLGKMTDNGADMLLSWDVEYFLDTCVPVFNEVRCSAGFGSLFGAEKTWLRGIVLSKVGTEDEIELIAATLSASSTQMNQLVKNITLRDPWVVTTYEDMWALTIGNYHAGAGCIGTALETTWSSGQELHWENITPNLLGECRGAESYVELVRQLSQ